MADTGFKSYSGPSSKSSSDKGDLAKQVRTTGPKPSSHPAQGDNQRSAQPLDDNLNALEDNFYDRSNQADGGQAASSSQPPAGFGNIDAPQPSRPSQDPAAGSESDTSDNGSSDEGTSGEGGQVQKPKKTKDAKPSPTKTPQSTSTPAPASRSRGGGFSKLKKKKLAIRLLLTSLVAMVSLLGFMLSLPFKLIHIVNVLLGHNDGGNQHTEEHASIKILQRILGLHLDKDGGYRSATGRPLHDRMANTRIDNLKARFAQDGITMEFDSRNRFVGLSRNGQSITGDLKDRNLRQKRTALTRAFRNLGYYSALKHILYTKALKLHAGVSWKFWPTDKAKKITEVMASKVRKGRAGDAALKEKPPPTDPNAVDEYNKAKAAGAAEVAHGNEIMQAVTDTFDETQDATKARQAGITAFRSAATNAFGFTGLAMLYCLIQDMIDNHVQEAHIRRTENLIRLGNMLATAKDEMQTGHLFAAHYGPFVQRFDGRSGNPNIPDEHSEDAKDFTKACAWKRAGDQPCNTNQQDYANYNPDLSEAANPDASQLKGVLSLAATLFQIPGTQAICSVLNSWFGWVILGVEFVASVASVGLKDALLKGVNGVATTLAITLVVDKILTAATDMAVTGTENAVGLINNGDAGLNLSAKDFGRFMGNRTGTDAEAAAISEAARQDQIALAQEKGWTYRTFAIENNNSILSRAVTHLPSSPQTAIAGLRSVITRIPTNFGAIFFHARPAWAAATANSYHFRAMVTTDEELERIDPEGAEKYLMQQVNGKTRLEMLGDPNTYTPANGEDPNTNDLMHCFVNKFRAPEQTDPICKDLGFLTKNGKENAENPGPLEILQKIFCDQHGACNESWVVELDVFCPNQPPEDVDGKCGKTTATVFDAYRIYLKHTFLNRIIAGDASGVDPFAGSAAPPPAAPGNANACQPGENQVDCAARLAAAIIANPNVQPAGALGDLQATVNKTAINNIHTCGRDARLHPALLYALNQTASPSGGNFKIRLTNIITPHGCDPYLHPKGRAMDVDNLVDPQGRNSNAGHPASNGGNAAVDRAFAEYIANLLPHGGGVLQANKCFPATIPPGIRSGSDTCNHIHVDVGTSVP